MKTTKMSRHGLTKANWIKLISDCLAAIGVNEHEIDFGSEGITVNKWILIGFEDKEELKTTIADEDHKIILRGYSVTTFHSTYSYIDGPDMVDTYCGFFATPYEAVSHICKMYVEERLSGVMEGFMYEEQDRIEAKYYKEMNELQANGVDSETNRDLYDDYQDRVERHNRQVLSRL